MLATWMVGLSRYIQNFFQMQLYHQLCRSLLPQSGDIPVLATDWWVAAVAVVVAVLSVGVEVTVAVASSAAKWLRADLLGAVLADMVEGIMERFLRLQMAGKSKVKGKSALQTTLKVIV